jgi:hypothetical protein
MQETTEELSEREYNMVMSPVGLGTKNHYAGEGSVSRSGRFTPDAHWIGGCVDTGICVDSFITWLHANYTRPQGVHGHTFRILIKKPSTLLVDTRQEPYCTLLRSEGLLP